MKVLRNITEQGVAADLARWGSVHGLSHKTNSFVLGLPRSAAELNR